MLRDNETSNCIKLVTTNRADYEGYKQFLCGNNYMQKISKCKKCIVGKIII